jgi:hypothetical protein
MAHRKKRSDTLPARAVAALAAALVLVLTILAASPELHERLHALGAAASATSHPSPGANAAEDEDGCVVTLFAQGLVLPLALLALAVVLRALRLPGFDLLDRVAVASPRYLRLPTQGPPLGLS